MAHKPKVLTEIQKKKKKRVESILNYCPNEKNSSFMGLCIQTQYRSLVYIQFSHIKNKQTVERTLKGVIEVW